MPEVVGEYIDRLTTVEMRYGKGNLPRGVMHRLYDAARASAGRPLVLGMAQSLVDSIGPKDTVVVLTGAGGPPALPNAEVDGILGAVAIARALVLTRRAEVVILTEERATRPMTAAIEASGMNVGRLNSRTSSQAIVHEVSPIGRDECIAHASKILADLNPSAVIGIEKLSPNRSGIIHGVTGLPYDDVHTKADVYFEQAAAKGILTCGIGDGGNEVGFGRIQKDVARIMPAGERCECPCAGGTAASTATDELVVAAISDWGGYALAAMLAFLSSELRALIAPQELERMLVATVNAGAFDGATARPTLSDDGVPLDSQKAYVTMLQQMVEIALSDLESPGH